MLESFVVEQDVGQAPSTLSEDLPLSETQPEDSPKEEHAPEKEAPKIVPPITPKKEPSKLAQQNQTNKENTQTKSVSTYNVAPAPAGGSDITLPVTHANYLNNPHPSYPRQSRRLGEQGKVMLAVHINVDGTASQGFVKQSSGHPRLDQIALETVLKWRFIAGKKAGVPQKMWVNIPIHFVLE